MTRMLRLVFVILLIPAVSNAQKDTLVKKLDSLQIAKDSAGSGSKNNIKEAAYEGAKLDFGTYFTLLGDDFKQQVTFPFHAKGKDWLKLAGFAAVTGGLALANKPIHRFAIDLRNKNKGVADASKYITRFGGMYEIYALAGFYASGLIFKTQKEKTTTALATQAYITAGVTSTIIKFLAAEQRPYLTDPNSGKSGPIFHGPFYTFKKTANGNKLRSSDYASFPSGHATAAFAAATVYAMEYRDKPLIPILSYSAATLIGLSRITESKHWPVDVLVGAMLGYLSGRQVVNNYHRYSRLKNGHPKTTSINFNLQSQKGHIMPGLVYSF